MVVHGVHFMQKKYPLRLFPIFLSPLSFPLKLKRLKEKQATFETKTQAIISINALLFPAKVC